jgi:putative colanic acid biosynthesis acetyltransferase WcaF
MRDERLKVDFSKFNNEWHKGNINASRLKQILWYYVNALIFNTAWLPVSGLKVKLLRVFGAKVGTGVVIKPSVNIKYPWMLQIGNHCWIGENVWIDNLSHIYIGDNVCISQGAMLLTGNHDYTKESFDLIVREITLEDGVWIGARSVVCPGVLCASHAILTVQSVATKNMEPYTIYQGNPATAIKERKLIKGKS